MTIQKVDVTGLFVTAGKAFPQANDVLATTSLSKADIWHMPDDGTRIELHGEMPVPVDYDSTPVFLVDYDCGATTGVMSVDGDLLKSVDELESFNQAGVLEAINVDDTVPATAWLRKRVSLAFTSANFAAEDIAQVIIAMDGADGGHTLAVPGRFHKITFTYDDGVV